MERIFAFVVLLGGIVANAAATRPPNILFCISDDQSFPHASAYGTRWINTPAFDRVAREGVLFTRAYTTNSKCAPSRAIILTGRQSWQLESAANHGGYYPEGHPTFVETLAQRGYFVGHTGKGWAPGEPGQVAGRRRELTGPAFNRHQAASPTTGISRADYVRNFQEFLASRPAGQPFCFWFGGYEPHRRYEAGSGLRAGKSPASIDHVPAFLPDNETIRSDLLDYALEIEYFDRTLGAMLALLEASGELDNTLVIVTSDNGMPFPRAKGTTYEASLHLPLAIRWPAEIREPGRRVANLTGFVDFAPTILAAAGIEASAMPRFAGESLLPLLRLQTAAPRAALAFGQERHDLGRPGDAGYPVRGVIATEWLYFENLASERWPMGDPVTGYLNTDGSPAKTHLLMENRSGRHHDFWKMAFGKRPEVELYHVASDPDCVRNLAGVPAHVSIQRELRAFLQSERERTEDPRLSGQVEFDDYPTASPHRGLYHRWVDQGEKFSLSWVNPGDAEAPDFDPARPPVNPTEPNP